MEGKVKRPNMAQLTTGDAARAAVFPAGRRTARLRFRPGLVNRRGERRRRPRTPLVDNSPIVRESGAETGTGPDRS